jgi:hypothetical protein
MADAGSDHGRGERVVALLEENVRNELVRQDIILGLGLSIIDIQALTKSVTAEVRYAFSVDWSPDWLVPGDVHTWEDYSGAIFGRCSVCLQDSPAQTDRDRAAAWVRAHERSHPA